jgi:molybdopterin-containing oxidoreductase family membrane subunit
MNYYKIRPILWVIIGLSLAIGAASVFGRLTQGLAMTDLGSYIPWGLWIAQDIYFISLSAGAFLISAMVYVFGVKILEPIGPLSLFTALIALIASMVHVWFDLGHLERFWHVYASPNWGSLLNYIVWAYSVYFLLLLAELFLAVKKRLWPMLGKTYTPASASRDKRILRIIAFAGIPLAISFHGGVGAVFGILVARPFWHVGLYPILFLIAALASGAAFLTFVVALFVSDHNARQSLVYTLGRISLGLILGESLYLFADFFQSLYQGLPQNVEAVKDVLSGTYWWAFWGIQVFLGTVVPVIVLTHPRLSRQTTLVGLAGLLIAIGFFMARLNLILPAMAVPELEGLRSAFYDPRLSFEYFPTSGEWGLSIGIIGFAAMLFLVGFERLPLTEWTNNKETA